jgi:cytochrome c553
VTSLQDLKDIAVYFAQQKTMQGKPTGSAAAKTGEKIFQEGVPKSGVYGCVNCHGNNGKGRGKGNSLFPVIGGQQKAYLVKQLKDFKAGTRKNDPAGMMGDIAKKLSDEEVNAVAEYLSGL